MQTTPPPPLIDSIAARLLRIIFGAYFVVTLVVTSGQLTLEYHDAQARLMDEIKAMEYTFGPGIASAVWSVNPAGLRDILAGIKELPTVVGVKVEDANGDVVAAVGIVTDAAGQRLRADARGQLNPAPGPKGLFDTLFSQTFAARHKDQDGQIVPIGKWTVYSSQQFVVNSVKYGFVLLLVNSVIKTLALWFIFLYVVNRWLGRPLRQLSAFVGQLTIENLGDRDFKLRHSGKNELHLLADKLNEMQDKLRSSVEENAVLLSQLQDLNRTLEIRVQDRTAEYEHANNALRETIAQLGRTRDDLVRTEKLAALGALVAGVAHELNTPIGNAITTATTMEDVAKEFHANVARGEIRKSTLTRFLDNTMAMADLVTRSCRRAGALISSFKQVAVDQTSEQRRPFDLKELVEDNIAAMRPSFRHTPWVIETDIPEDIQCDSYPGPLGQVVANLIQNALVHAFDGRDAGTVRVLARQVQDRVEMVVQDDGHGMEPHVLGRIFEPFYTTRLGQGGSGLGLSVSLNIVTELLGGTMVAESQPGKGSRFLLQFPTQAPDRRANRP